MIDRTIEGYRYQIVSTEDRYNEIIRVMKSSKKPMSASEICQQYVLGRPLFSDTLSTGHILNVLALTGMVLKTTEFKGKSPRHKYELVNK